VQAAERLKQTRSVFHTESRAAVCDAIHMDTIFAAHSFETNPDLRALAAVFPSIADQIADERGHQPSIGAHEHVLLNEDLDRPFRLRLA
jgi:hypothetical protein